MGILITLVSILLLSQIVSFILIFKKIKPIIKPKENRIYLDSIPKDIKYEDLDKDHKLILDLIETIKIEEWNLEINSEYSEYYITFTSNDDEIQVVGSLSGNSNPKLYSLKVKTKHGNVNQWITDISIDYNSPIKNEIITFLWKYILDYHKEQNDKTYKKYEETTNHIRSKLKSVNRANKIDQIL